MGTKTETTSYTIPVDGDGIALGDTNIGFEIQPADYTAYAAYVAIYADSDGPGGNEPFPVVWIPVENQGTGSATIAAGYKFVPGWTYSARIVLNPGTSAEIKGDEIPLITSTTVSGNLTVDSNNNGELDPADDIIEEAEPGKVIPVNDDFDCEPGVPDLDHIMDGRCDNEDDLAQIKIETVCTGPLCDGSHFELIPKNLNFISYLWTSPQRGTAIPFPIRIAPNQVVNYYIEGMAPESGDFELYWIDKNGAISKMDSVKVTVFKVETETVATTPASRSRTKIGIGEEVVCNVVPRLSANWPPPDGGGTVSKETETSATFTASKSPTTSTVHAQVGSADYKVRFTVVGPNGMTTSLARDESLGSPGINNIGAISVFNCQVQPDDVSFYRVEFRENIPGETFLWPDGTFDTTSAPRRIVPWNTLGGFDNRTTDTVSCGPAPATRIFNGTNYVDFYYTVRVPEEYKDENGNWVEWLPGEKHTKEFSGADLKARVILEASNTAFGGWMGPWQ